MIECPHCGKKYSPKGIGTHIWRNHGDGKDFNPNKGYDNDRVAWNKGLTKEENQSLKSMSEKLSGRESIFKGKKHSIESRKKMSDSALLAFKEGRHSTWNTRNIQSYAEVYFENVLINNGLINFVKKEHKIKVEGKNKCYFLDFYFEDKGIDLEIDGSQHELPERAESDKIRDEYLSTKGIKVFRIKWYDPKYKRDLLESQINDFLLFYNAEVV